MAEAEVARAVANAAALVIPASWVPFTGKNVTGGRGWVGWWVRGQQFPEIIT